MRIRGRIPLVAGEHEIFGPGFTDSLLGQRFEGGKVVWATRVTDQLVFLDVEMDAPPELIDRISWATHYEEEPGCFNFVSEITDLRQPNFD